MLSVRELESEIGTVLDPDTGTAVTVVQDMPRLKSSDKLTAETVFVEPSIKTDLPYLIGGPFSRMLQRGTVEEVGQPRAIFGPPGSG